MELRGYAVDESKVHHPEYDVQTSRIQQITYPDPTFKNILNVNTYLFLFLGPRVL